MEAAKIRRIAAPLGVTVGNARGLWSSGGGSINSDRGPAVDVGEAAGSSAGRNGAELAEGVAVGSGFPAAALEVVAASWTARTLSSRSTLARSVHFRFC